MNRTCDHCQQELRSDGPLLNYCNDACRSLYHQRLTRSMSERRRAETPRQESPGVAAVLADRAAGSRAASLGEAETALASQRTAEDTARLYAAEEAAMITKLALGQPKRRNNH